MMFPCYKPALFGGVSQPRVMTAEGSFFPRHRGLSRGTLGLGESSSFSAENVAEEFISRPIVDVVTLR